MSRQQNILTGLFLCAMTFLCTVSQAAAPCQITGGRTAHAFYSNEVINLSCKVNLPVQEISWVAKNYSGSSVTSGKFTAGDGASVSLPIPRLGTGAYYLTFTFADASVYENGFCVLPRPDAAPGDAGLWGFQISELKEPWYGLLAQAGGRYLRFDLSWPDHEKTEGAYNPTKAQTVATALERWGLQMIPTLGYTPGFTNRMPLDYNYRGHTWAPDSVEHWQGYVTLLRDTLANRTVAWPSKDLVSDEMTPVRQQVPQVRTWEIWNEVDQNFYYGPWVRYLDLLRVAHGTLKQTSVNNRVCYGGGCAHWTELGMTMSYGSGAYFDEISWHSNNDIEVELPKYYYGCPQLGYRNQMPRRTLQTECYPTVKSGIPEPEYMLRLYTTLKAYREEGYCLATIGGLLNGMRGTNSHAFTWTTASGEYAPNPNYVAWAVTRQLLSSAVYIGPVTSLGAGVTAHLFVREGAEPLLVAWSDTGARITIKLGSRAAKVDAMGGRTPLAGSQMTGTLTGSPLAIVGVNPTYFAPAVLAYFDQVMNTEYGFSYTVDSPYVRNLGSDCNWGGGVIARNVALRNALINSLTFSGPGQQIPPWRRLQPLATEIRSSMISLVDSAIRYKVTRPEIPTSIWRLQRLAEWVGDLQNLAPDPSGLMKAQTLSQEQLVNSLQSYRQIIINSSLGTTQILSESLLDRARLMMDKNAGAGTNFAAQTAMIAAAEYSRIEKRINNKIILVAHFPTAEYMKKTYLMRPGMTHTIQAQVYNFTNSEVSGTLNWSFPENWEPRIAAVPFTVAPQGRTERIGCEVAITGAPTPWERRTASPSGNRFDVMIPSSLWHQAWPTLSGVTSTGEKIDAITYETVVGEWVK